MRVEVFFAELKDLLPPISFPIVEKKSPNTSATFLWSLINNNNTRCLNRVTPSVTGLVSTGALYKIMLAVINPYGNVCG